MFEFIPKNIAIVLDELEKAGFEVYLVGGCVRDEALGAPPHDYDITTNAKPDEMLRVFSEYRVIETGLKHGTLTVISGGETVEPHTAETANTATTGGPKAYPLQKISLSICQDVISR